MTGSEHYAEAERLMTKARSLGGGDTYNSVQVRPQVILAEAQVHATLALAAATAHHDADAWRGVLGEPVPPPTGTSSATRST
jgi:hypothetical protein